MEPLRYGSLPKAQFVSLAPLILPCCRSGEPSGILTVWHDVPSASGLREIDSEKSRRLRGRRAWARKAAGLQDPGVRGATVASSFRINREVCEALASPETFSDQRNVHFISFWMFPTLGHGSRSA